MKKNQLALVFLTLITMLAVWYFKSPNSTVDEMPERAYNHTKDKYGNNGYAKHYVVDNDYIEFRNKILELINDKEKFNYKYYKLFCFIVKRIMVIKIYK